MAVASCGPKSRLYRQAQSCAANISSFPEKPIKGVDGLLGNMMLNTDRVGFGGSVGTLIANRLRSLPHRLSIYYDADRHPNPLPIRTPNS